MHVWRRRLSHWVFGCDRTHTVATHTHIQTNALKACSPSHHMGVWSSTQCCGEGLTTLRSPTTARTAPRFGGRRLLPVSSSLCAAAAAATAAAAPEATRTITQSIGVSQQMQRGTANRCSVGAAFCTDLAVVVRRTYGSGCSSASSGGAPRRVSVDQWLPPAEHTW